MASNVPDPSPSMRLNTVEPRTAKASIRINSSTGRGDADLHDQAVSLFFAALADVGMSDKEAAYTMGLDPAQLSRVKSRQAKLPFDAMWRVPNGFWLALRSRIDDARQLTDTSARELKAARIAELLRLLLEVA